MSKFCMKCGNALDDNAYICSNCGQAQNNIPVGGGFLQKKTIGIINIICGGLALLFNFIGFTGDFYEMPILFIGASQTLTGTFFLLDKKY